MDQAKQSGLTRDEGIGPSNRGRLSGRVFEARGASRTRFYKDLRSAAFAAGRDAGGVVYEVMPGRVPRVVWRTGDDLPGRKKATARQVLTVAEAVERAGLAKQTIKRAVALGRIEGYKAPGAHGGMQWFLYADSVDAYEPQEWKTRAAVKQRRAEKETGGNDAG